MFCKNGLVYFLTASVLFFAVSCQSDYAEQNSMPPPKQQVDIQGTVEARVAEILVGSAMKSESPIAMATPVPTIDVDLIAQVVLDNMPTPPPAGAPIPKPDIQAIVEAILDDMTTPSLSASDVQAIVEAVLANSHTPAISVTPGPTVTPVPRK